MATYWILYSILYYIQGRSKHFNVEGDSNFSGTKKCVSNKKKRNRKFFESGKGLWFPRIWNLTLKTSKACGALGNWPLSPLINLALKSAVYCWCIVATGYDTIPLNKQNVVIVVCILGYYSSGHRMARNLQWGSCYEVWGRSPLPPEAIGESEGRALSRRRHVGLGKKPSALENFVFFCKNDLILGLFG